MELLFLFLSLLLIFVSLTLTILTYNNKASTTTLSVPNLPPGSFGWPLLGETLEFLYSNPEKFVRDRMAKHSPQIFKTSVLGHHMAVVCGPTGHKLLFSNKHSLTTVWRPHSMDKLFNVHNSSHSEESRLLRQPPFLKPEALTTYLPKMCSITKQHLDAHWEGGDEVMKVFPLAKRFTLALACRILMGVDDPERVVRLVGSFDDVIEGLHSVPVKWPGTVFYRASKAAREILRELRGVVKEKRAALAMSGGAMEDVLSYMVSSSGERVMGEAEIADKIMGLLVAGYSTVATAITFLMKYTGENPQVYNNILNEQNEIIKSKKVGDEGLEWEDIHRMKYSWNVVQEVMRLVPPLQGTFREALADFTFAGFTIPKGWKIYWTVSSTNKNPQYFPDPERFDPSRFEGTGPAPYTYVPFGGGARTCPGKEYARLAVLVFLHNVVKRFKWETVFPDEKIIAEMMPTPALGLPLRIKPHLNLTKSFSNYTGSAT